MRTFHKFLREMGEMPGQPTPAGGQPAGSGATAAPDHWKEFSDMEWNVLQLIRKLDGAGFTQAQQFFTGFRAWASPFEKALYAFQQQQKAGAKPAAGGVTASRLG